MLFQKKGKSNPTLHIKKPDDIQNKKKKGKQNLCNQQSVSLKNLVLVLVKTAHSWNSLALGVRTDWKPERVKLKGIVTGQQKLRG